MKLLATYKDDCLSFLLAQPRRGFLHGLHRRAFSLECEGVLLSVLSEPPLHPYSLVLPADDFRSFPLMKEALLTPEAILFPTLTIGLTEAQVQSQPLLFPRFEPGRLRQNLASLERYLALFGKFGGYALIEPRVEARNYQGLVGTGLGLTPSGDDFLVGVLLSLYAWSRIGLELPLRRQLRHELRIEGTTRESVHFLAQALQDRFSHGWIRWLDDLFSSESFTIEKACSLVRRGATSGTDMALGMIHGLKAGLAEKGEP